MTARGARPARLGLCLFLAGGLLLGEAAPAASWTQAADGSGRAVSEMSRTSLRDQVAQSDAEARRLARLVDAERQKARLAAERARRLEAQAKAQGDASAAARRKAEDDARAARVEANRAATAASAAEAQRRKAAQALARLQALLDEAEQKQRLAFILAGIAGLAVVGVIVGGWLWWRHKRPPTPFQDCFLEGEGRTLKLPGSLLAAAEGVVLGRHPGEAEVVLSDQDVSRRHARFTVGSGGLEVEDLDSLGGTVVDGQPLMRGEKRPINDGSSLEFAGHVFRLRLLA